VAHVLRPSYSGGRNQEDQGSKPTWQIVPETLSQKNPSQKRAGGVAQVGECLPSKRKALCSNPSNIKKKKFKWNCHMVLLCSITLWVYVQRNQVRINSDTWTPMFLPHNSQQAGHRMPLNVQQHMTRKENVVYLHNGVLSSHKEWNYTGKWLELRSSC
jgi:hypothetical protein